jgi:hypothetical protein
MSHLTHFRRFSGAVNSTYSPVKTIEVRMRSYRSVLSRTLSISLALVFALSIGAEHRAYSAGTVDPDADYDRMDGTGKSGETVQIIEWEGNLEVHVYPPGSLKGLAATLDLRNKAKPVMVLGYRFVNNPKQQFIRRAILGITMNNGFKAYKDPTEGEFDKIIISNNGLSGQVALFKLDPTPTSLYPEGYPGGTAVAKSNSGNNGNRAPASFNGGGNSGNGNSGNGNVYHDNSQGDLGAGAGYGTPSQEDAPAPRQRRRGRYPAQDNSGSQDNDSGTIQPFGMSRPNGSGGN